MYEDNLVAKPFKLVAGLSSTAARTDTAVNDYDYDYDVMIMSASTAPRFSSYLQLPILKGMVDDFYCETRDLLE
jgi:hypothetical protein